MKKPKHYQKTTPQKDETHSEEGLSPSQTAAKRTT